MCIRDSSVGLIADKGGGIDCDYTGRALADGIIIHQLVLSSPAAVFNDLPLEQGQHGIATAKRAYTDAGKGEKQVKIRVQKQPAPFRIRYQYIIF